MRRTTRGRLLAGALDSFAELAWPTRCVGCNLPGELLCERCCEGLPWISQRWACPMCGAPFGWLTCTECGRSMGGTRWPMRASICAFAFQDVAALIPALLKDGHELRLAGLVAAAMACSLDEASAWDADDGLPRFSVEALDALCFVPATAAAYVRRGFDHMELVGEALSPLIGVPMRDVLARVTAKDQRTLDRARRAANLAGTCRVVGGVSGMRLLLVDDVLTTGASMCEAARALLGAGAVSVTACAFARVWGS